MYIAYTLFSNCYYKLNNYFVGLNISLYPSSKRRLVILVYVEKQNAIFDFVVNIGHATNLNCDRLYIREHFSSFLYGIYGIIQNAVTYNRFDRQKDTKAYHANDDVSSIRVETNFDTKTRRTHVRRKRDANRSLFFDY